ncbi:unnamed protein product [Staurois parvus]|uniref:Uncharacterized protein n=1 Tax=Staurois parvus TaxID=386267 RepID=A0ABN9CMQ4_9NEOB|nr:unnamed protein product [Staurois parvus]
MSGSDILLTTIHVITDWPISALWAAGDVNHRVPASTSRPSLGDRRKS